MEIYCYFTRNSPCDGIEGTVKRETSSASLQGLNVPT